MHIVSLLSSVSACGVCSTAHDLWTRMATIDDFETDTLLCGVSYLLNPDKTNRFDTLVACAERVGLSPECALLWAHYGAAIISECSSECNAGTGSETNGPPPECALAPCVECPLAWNENFPKLSGRTMEGSGINEGTAKLCSRFSNIEHDPCVGATTGSELELSPTTVPTSSGLDSSVGLILHFSVAFITWSAIVDVL